MKKFPTIISAILLTIQIARVANFADREMGAGLLGWLFSLALAAGVFVSAYYTRQAITRKDGVSDKRSAEAQKMAWISLVLFVSADGYFNLADVLTGIDASNLLILVSAIIYGAMPTVASAMLAALQGKVDRLPSAPSANKSQVAASVNAWIRRAFEQNAEKRKAEAIAKRDPLTAYCDVCKWSHNGYKSEKARKAAEAAHGRRHIVKVDIAA